MISVLNFYLDTVVRWIYIKLPESSADEACYAFNVEHILQKIRF